MSRRAEHRVAPHGRATTHLPPGGTGSWTWSSLCVLMPGRRGAFFLCALCALVVLSTGCDKPVPPPPPAAPAQTKALRIAALSPAIAVILRDLGQGGTIVARHGYDSWSDAALPVAGDQQGFDYETLLRVNPTHVLVQWGGKTLPDRLVSLAAQHRWVVRDLPLLTLDDVEHAAETLFDLTGQAGGGSAPAWKESPLAERLAATWRARTPSPSRIGRVLLLYSASPPTALGPGSFHHQLLVRLGGAPAITDGSPFMRLDVEDVLRIAPDAIVLVRPEIATKQQGSASPARTGSPAWRMLRGDDLTGSLGPLAGRAIPAVQYGRVGVLTDPLAAVPGTNLIGLADDLAALLDAMTAPPAQPDATRATP